ncbi:hypothetical protein L0337_38840 [candidate division KSB1 bacterium]|nr:hypothetical protein [candidate division KSB1 bacterium]
MKHFRAVTLSCVLAFTLNAQSWDVEKKEEIRRALKFSHPTGSKEVEVDNVNGSITVTGYEGQEVQLVANKTIQARSQEKIQEAQEKVRLEITEEGNAIKLYVDAPFRCRDGSVNYRGDRYYGYSVYFDFELKVPREAGVYLKTINDGDIKVENIAGDYEVENINGGIAMLEVSGAGRVYALNDDVKILFAKNPSGDSYYGSLNGEVEVSFRPDLSADLRFKTFNGEVFTDFPVTYLANATPSRERRKGKFVYKQDRSFKVRVSNGGPELEFDAFNGDIRVIKRSQ